MGLDNALKAVFEGKEKTRTQNYSLDTESLTFFFWAAENCVVNREH